MSVWSEASQQVVLEELAVLVERQDGGGRQTQAEEIADAHRPEPASAVRSPEVTS